MPSLRAGLNAAQPERAIQLALTSCDTSWASSRPASPESKWLIMSSREVLGGVPFCCPGLAAPNSLAAYPA